MTATSLIDWDFAVTTGRRLAGTGPKVTPAQARDAVRELRDAAARVGAPVAETARMHAPASAEPALVVDRKGWIGANAASMGAMLASVEERMVALRKPDAPEPNALVAAGAAKATGAEAGAMLAFLSGKVLGQYDIAPGGTPRLLLVAPNIVEAERELDVDPHDFRTWVALHEETHRVQFTAVPWLRDHMIEESRALSVDLVPDPDQLRARLTHMARNLPAAFAKGGNGLSDVVTTPEQRARIADLTAVMSLLEGHADVVMDDVGPSVVPSVATIRERFTQRRRGAGSLDVMVRRLLGLEAKMRQYSEGATFVRAVVDRVGVDGFNAVWTSPQTLPSADEIAFPQRWVTRVHG